MTLTLARLTGLSEADLYDRMQRLDPLDQHILELRFRYRHDLLGTSRRIGLTRIETRLLEREAIAKLKAGGP